MKDNILNTLQRLVHVPGISGTDSEDAAAVEIYNIIKEIPYFNINSENIQMHKIEKDPYGRHFVTAMLKGKSCSNSILVLTGHYDVVDIEEYGHLKKYAFDITECTKRISELNLNEDAFRDAKSGDWIFARGAADMKYGIALHIEILRKLSKERNFNGNILFLAVPGEESNSEGMLAAVKYLANRKEEGYDFSGLLLSECCFPKYPGDNEKRIYMGTCGKLMPFFFCCGKETHVCEPFSGLNPNLLVSKINELMELNTDFCNTDKSNVTPPPSCLKMADLKELYSVQTPIYAVCYYNLITLESDTDVIMKKLKEIAVKAFNNTLNAVAERNKSFMSKRQAAQREESVLNIESSIYTFSEIYKKVYDIYGEEFQDKINRSIKKWIALGLDNQTIGINIVKETCESYPDKKPMIIIGFIPPFYPDKRLGNDAKSMKFEDALQNTIAFAKESFDVDILKEEHFMGICDLSYTGFNGNNIDTINKNLCAGENYVLPLEDLKRLDIPSVVFGGFGKDFHKYTERLNVSYSMDIVPKLYIKLIMDILK